MSHQEAQEPASRSLARGVLVEACVGAVSERLLAGPFAGSREPVAGGRAALGDGAPDGK
jgi:hypothetical protein